MNDSVFLRCGRFNCRLNSNSAAALSVITNQYQTVNPTQSSIDFEANLIVSRGLRRFIRPQARFYCNGKEPFMPMPAEQAYPLFEWGMNWAVNQHFHNALVIHAAVVTKDDMTLILPGLPGAGKSTLCAALVYGAGWRLLSDELTLFDWRENCVLPNPRPVSLKNHSIDIVKQHFNVAMTPEVKDTVKGTVAHTVLNKVAVDGVNDCPAPTHILFPKYDPSLPTEKVLVEKLDKANCFLRIADNAFNYSLLGTEGFFSVKKLVEECDVYTLNYGGSFEAVFDAVKGLSSNVE